MISIIIYQALYYLIRILDFLILIRIILSWLPIGRGSVIVNLVYTLTEPVLGPIRNMLSKSPIGGPGMMLDFSPIIAYFLFDILLRVAGSILIY